MRQTNASVITVPQEERADVNAIYQEMRRRICTLEYPFQHRLAEVELGNEFGVSRTPIREALQRLKNNDLIDTRHGGGGAVL